MNARLRDLLVVLAIVLASNGVGVWFYSHHTTTCNKALDTLSLEVVKLQETISILQQEKKELLKKSESYFFQILDLQDQLSWADSKTKELEAENKRLRQELANKVVSPTTSYGVAGDHFIYQETFYRSLKGSFIFNVGVGYGTRGVKLRVDGDTVYGDPQYGLFPVLGVNYYFSHTQGAGIQVQGNEAIMLNYSFSSDFLSGGKHFLSIPVQNPR